MNVRALKKVARNRT